MDATPSPQPPSPQPWTAPFAVWNPTRGIWETSQLDLYGLLAPYSAIWPTSGTTHAGSAYPLPTSEHPTPAFASSSSPASVPVTTREVRSGVANGYEVTARISSVAGRDYLDYTRVRRGADAQR